MKFKNIQMKIKLVLCNLIICFFLFNCNENVDRLITFDENFEYSFEQHVPFKINQTKKGSTLNIFNLKLLTHIHLEHTYSTSTATTTP